MKTLASIAFSVLVALSPPAKAEPDVFEPLAYDALGVEIISVVPGGGSFDDHVLWSKDGRFIALNYLGQTWLRLDVTTFTYGSADWAGAHVAYLTGAAEEVELPEGDFREMWEATRRGGQVDHPVKWC